MGFADQMPSVLPLRFGWNSTLPFSATISAGVIWPASSAAR